MARVAITRGVSPAIADCELTHQARRPIDFDAATRQHAEYENVLAALGCRVERLAADPAAPDCVFVEDVALVFDELAVLTRPGAASRRRETPAVATALGSGAVAAALGGYHSCARKFDGTLWCWGENYAGQLGDGGRVARPTPQRVPDVPAMRQVAAGRDQAQGHAQPTESREVQVTVHEVVAVSAGRSQDA